MTTTSRIILAVIALIPVIFFGGCASVTMASAAEDAQGKKFEIPSGKASVYISREMGVGLAVVAQTQLDGRIVGALAPSTYQVLTVAPGHHTIGVSGQENVEQVALDAKEGQIYFFDVTINMGWNIGRPHIEAVPEDKGRNAVSGDKRAQATMYE